MGTQLTIPMCWKCSSAITANDTSKIGKILSSQILVGCKECDDITSFADAKKLCPLLHSTN
jgi:hypothetical protein